jgi:hypothetical protein
MAFAAVIGGRARNGIKAALVERVAFEQSAPREPAASPRTMTADRLVSIMRTGRMEAALVTDERTERQLVTANQRAQTVLRDLPDFHKPSSPGPQTKSPELGAAHGL